MPDATASQYPVFELYNSAFATPTCSLINLSHLREDFETLRKAVPATSLFLSYMDPLCHVSRGKTGEGETGKRDYQHRPRTGCGDKRSAAP